MTQEDYYNKLSFGMITTLFDRYTNNLTWLNIPLILYNVVLHTIKYIPFLAEHILRMTILAFIGFFIGAAIVMYLDYKYIFQSERQFMYNKMEYFENHYNKVRDLIRLKSEDIIKNRQITVQ
jgi:uncharacterized membrane protein